MVFTTNCIKKFLIFVFLMMPLFANYISPIRWVCAVLEYSAHYVLLESKCPNHTAAMHHGPGAAASAPTCSPLLTVLFYYFISRLIQKQACSGLLVSFVNVVLSCVCLFTLHQYDTAQQVLGLERWCQVCFLLVYIID